MAKTFFSKDRTILALFVVLALIGLWLFKEKERTIFPTASIDLKIGKQQILHSAENWSKKLGYNKEKLVKSIVFDDDEDSKTFLDYELGNAQADELMHTKIPIFFWDCKFRKPFDQETMEIQLDPKGKLVAFSFRVANDKKIPSISHDEAKKMAFAFVNENTGWNESDCKLVTDDTTAQINRTDYKFTWEDQGAEWHGARLRSEIEIAGNTIKGFDYYLKRPEAWDRNYATMRTKNTLLEAVASIFFFSLYPVAIFIFLQGISRKNIRWRFVAFATAIFTAIFVAENYNNFPVSLAGYSSDTSYKIFLLQTLIYPVLALPFMAISIAVMAGAGEIIYRRLFPNKIALENIFTRAGMGTREVRIGLVIGLCWFAITLGYQILYYWLGKNFHFWCPLEVDNYQVLSTYLPWVSAVNLGAFAAGNEEILYRVLMLGLAKFVLRRFWLANILQAAAWGFMHSSYPQQPCYARGLELTIEGMLEGWLINRFGLLACFIGHYCFDAFACVTALFSAPLTLKLSSVLPFLPVVLTIAYSYYASKNAPTDETSLANKSVTCPELAPAPNEISNFDPIAKYNPLAKKTRWALVLFTLFGFIFYFATKEKFEPVGANAKPLHINRQQAINKAKAYLINKHFDLTGYKIGTQLNNEIPGHTEIQYVFEQLGYKKTKTIIRDVTSSFTWEVRFVKPLSPTEYTCSIDENGRISGFTIQKGEDDQGAKLSEKNARVLAEDFLKQDPNFSPFVFDDVSVDKKKNRTDYTFTFKVPKYKVNNADFKIGIDVTGDVAGDSFWQWDLPDKWKWERTKRSTRVEIFSIISTITSIAMSLAFIYWIIVLFRANKVHWRYALMIAAVLAIGDIIGNLNQLTSFYSAYRSTVPLNTFFIIAGVALLIKIVFLFGMNTFAIAIVLAGASETTKLTAKTVLYEAFVKFSKHLALKNYREMLLDSVLLSTAMLAALSLLSLFHQTLDFYFAHEVSTSKPAYHLANLVNSFFGPAGIAINILWQLAMVPLMVCLLVTICKLLKITTYWRAMATFILLYALFNLASRHWQDFFIGFVSGAATISVFWFIVTRGISRNILSIFVLVWLTYTCKLTSEMWQYGWPTFSSEIIVATVLAVLPFLGLLFVYLMPNMQTNKSAIKQ